MLARRKPLKLHSDFTDNKYSSQSHASRHAPNKAGNDTNQHWHNLALGTQTSSSLIQRQTNSVNQTSSDEQPMALFENSMCPSKVEFVGHINNNDHFNVSNSVIRCRVYVKFESADDKDAIRMSQLLQDASNGKRKVCLKFEMKLADPDCEDPREVFSVTPNP